MSLNFDLSKIANFQEVCHKPGGNDTDGYELNPITDGLIWSCMTVGLGEITEKNIEEWLFRLALADKLFGTMMYLGSGPERKPRPFTREDLTKHIGLQCNVSNEKRPSFNKRMLERFYRDEQYRQKNEELKARNAG